MQTHALAFNNLINGHSAATAITSSSLGFVSGINSRRKQKTVDNIDTHAAACIHACDRSAATLALALYNTRNNPYAWCTATPHTYQMQTRNALNSNWVTRAAAAANSLTKCLNLCVYVTVLAWNRARSWLETASKPQASQCLSIKR